MADFKQAVAYVLTNEGSNFTNRPQDAGGPTKWGITLELLQRVRGAQVKASDVAALTQDEAEAIYCEVFWVPLRLGDLISQGVATAILDGAVNFGPHRSVVFAQRIVRAAEDGVLGPATIELLNSADLSSFVLALAGKWQDYYVDVVTANPRQIEFLKGWLARARQLVSHHLLPVAGA